MIDYSDKIKRSEQDIISLLILSPNSIYFFIENISPRDFKDKRHAIIYRAIQYLFFQKNQLTLFPLPQF
jgi:replicative DNA helicase